MDVQPQRLSSLSTSTLTLILELTRSSQFNIEPSPSLAGRINRNLSTLRDGINILQQQKQERKQDVSEEVLLGLRKQYKRLSDLVEGHEGIQYQPLVDTSSGTLISTEDDEQEDMYVYRSPYCWCTISHEGFTGRGHREYQTLYLWYRTSPFLFKKMKRPPYSKTNLR